MIHSGGPASGWLGPGHGLCWIGVAPCRHLTGWAIDSGETFPLVARQRDYNKSVTNTMPTMKPNRLPLARLIVIAFTGACAVAASEARAETHVGIGLSVGVPLPNGYAEVSVGNDRYYYHRGTFYRPGRHGYQVVRAPRGCIVHELPSRYARVYFGGTLYYRYDDVYYQPCPGGYVVVEPPVTVLNVPASASVPATQPQPAKSDDYQSVWVGDVEYQFHDGQFFKKTADGLVWAIAPLGALTKVLPGDARSVWYQDIEYFECDEVYFRKTPDGYKVIEAPWKKTELTPALGK